MVSPSFSVKKLAKLSLLPIITFASFSPVAYAWEKDQTYKITILHTNDHHGRFWQNEQGEYGLAARKTLIDNLRKEVEAAGGSLLLLDGGDVNTGVPESDLQDAEPDFRGMNLIGYDAVALGNHEFDNPIDVLRKQQSWVDFPLLSANIYKEGTNERLFKPYEIFDKQGVKIAVIGLTTNDTIKIGNPEYLQGIEFKAPADEAKKVVEELRNSEKPDIIIAATHMGHYDNGNHGSNAPGDVEMARSLPKGYLNMIVGGHSQDPVCMESENVKATNYVPGTPCQPDQQNGTWIVQAHEWGKYVGRADFEFKNGEFTLKNYQLIPVNLKEKIKNDAGDTEYRLYTQEIEQSKEMLDLLKPFQDKGQEQLSVKIGSVNSRLEGDRSKVRFEQTNLANLLLQAQIERTNADLGVMSGGGVRDSIEAGDITYKDVLKVQPFGNTVVYVDLKGSELEEYLAVAASMKTDSGAYAQFANVSLVTDGTKVRDVKIKGQPLEMDKTYRLATLSFNASGGDGYPKVENHPAYVNTGFVDAEVLKEFISKNSPLDASKFDAKGDIVYE